MENRTDYISRQAVLDIIESYHGHMPNDINHQIWCEIKDLPSIQPKEDSIVDNRTDMFETVENFMEKMIYENGMDDIYYLLDTYGLECEHYIRTRALTEINNVIDQYKNVMCD